MRASSDPAVAAQGFNVQSLFRPQFVQNVQDAYRNRMSSPGMRGREFLGLSATKGGPKAFTAATGLENKIITHKDGTFSWRGFSGILQFIHKFPFGYLTRKDWGKTLNQIFWNLFIFVFIFGMIYSAMIRSGALGVPDGIKEQTPNEFTQGLYFAVVTTTTLGFGDITPATVGGQIVVMVHILLFFMFNFIWTLDYGKPEGL